jgi:NAD(P)-dependent dehydrogenase (short-subunit alcohol dehydrogenase family)
MLFFIKNFYGIKSGKNKIFLRFCIFGQNEKTMDKKIILVTGATDGIGKQTALELAQKGHKVLVHGRNKSKSEAAAEEISKATGNESVKAVHADLTDFQQIKVLSDEIKNRYDRLDVLLNNAGVFENEKVILPNGLERTFMVNHMAPFALTTELLGLLKSTPGARIVNVSSMAQSGSIDFNNLNGEKYFDPYNAYAVSKLENVLFTYKLARMLKDENVTANCLHPGVVSTKLLYAGWGVGGSGLHHGTRTSVFAAVSPEMEGKTGLYLVSQKPAKSAAISYDKKVQDKLWEISMEIVRRFE